MQLPEHPNELIQDLNRSYELELAEHLSLDEVEAFLAEKINSMIRENFGALVQLLYRVDVNESKLKQLLSDRPLAEGQDRQNAGDRQRDQQHAEKDTGRIIARLIMERQWQKVESRRQHRHNPLEGNQEW